MLKDTHDLLQAAMQELSGNPDLQRLSKGFIYPSAIATHSLLFIGDSTGHIDAHTPPIHGYKLAQFGNRSPFFQKFEEVSDNCRTPWGYIDLLFDRNADSTNVAHGMASKQGRTYLEFQLGFTETLIAAARPMAIVLCSACTPLLSSHPSLEWFGNTLQFDNNIGTYRFGDVPVFISASLSGTEALDAESLLRLEWHILLVLQWEILPELERLREEKNQIVKSGQYEKAAGVRDLERLLKMRLGMLQEAAL